MLDHMFCSHQDNIQMLLKHLQLSTRALHHLCSHSKVTVGRHFAYLPMLRPPRDIYTIDNSGSKNCYVWFWGTPCAQVTWYCTCAVNFVAFIMGKCYFSLITWLNLCRSTVKVTKWIGKLGSGISEMWIIFAPGDRSRDTAHAQWPFQVKVMWSDWVAHNSGTDNYRMLKIGMCTGHAKLNSPDIAKVKRS